jgi:hypothetical protein
VISQGAEEGEGEEEEDMRSGGETSGCAGATSGEGEKRRGNRTSPDQTWPASLFFRARGKKSLPRPGHKPPPMQVARPGSTPGIQPWFEGMRPVGTDDYSDPSEYTVWHALLEVFGVVVVIPFAVFGALLLIALCIVHALRHPPEFAEDGWLGSGPVIGEVPRDIFDDPPPESTDSRNRQGWRRKKTAPSKNSRK